MKKIQEKKKDVMLASNTNQEKKAEERVGFILPSISGDQTIWLGQSIIALIRLNQSLAYSEKDNNGLLEELFVGLLEHFKLDYKRLYKLYLEQFVLESGYDYKLDIVLEHTIIEKKEN